MVETCFSNFSSPWNQRSQRSVSRSTRNVLKHFLFIGGVHGVGKSTITKVIEDKFEHVKRIEESVDMDGFFFKHRNKIRDTSEIVWYVNFLEKIVEAINDRTCKHFVVDRTIFDFIPYCDGIACDFIWHNAYEFLHFLIDKRCRIDNVIITERPEEIYERIKKRNRDVAVEEVSTLADKISGFNNISKRLFIPMVENGNSIETIEKIGKLFPDFFVV